MDYEKSKKTHYGDEDPEAADMESDEELFETAKTMGWSPQSFLDKEFAARYQKWLEQKGT